MKKKPQWGLLIVGYLVIGYMGYLLSWTYKPGMDILQFSKNIDYVFRHPFGRNYWNSYSAGAILVCMGIVSLLFLYYTIYERNYMRGKEYGTSDWADAKVVTKDLGDSDESKNKIITEHLRISTDSRTTDLNNNLLAIGGAGCGKSFKFCIPNLLSCSFSYVVTDPKGELLRKCADKLKAAGYVIKVINLVKMSESDCYNPFDYIRKEEDVVKLINNLIANTTPKKANKGDPFWESATCSQVVISLRTGAI